MKKIYEGDTAEIYDYNKTTVLKLYKKNKLESLTELCKQEFTVLQTLYENQYPVPEPHKIIKIDDRPGYLMQKIEGVLLSKLIYDNNKLDEYSSMLGTMHKAIHSNELTKFNIPILKNILHESLKHVDAAFLDYKDKLLTIFKSINSNQVLTHGDFAPNNIIVAKDKVYIIDWADVMCGDNYADIARTIMFLADDYNPYIQKYFTSSQERTSFIKNYIKTYEKNSNNIDYDKLKKWLVVNCVLEYSYIKNMIGYNRFAKKIYNFICKFMENEQICFYEHLC